MIHAPIPRGMWGGWIRSGIALDGAAPTEPALVWWLQAPSRHCDLRVPYEGADGLMAFAGTTSWSDPQLTWTPELELDPSVFADIGEITWDGPDMLETGTTTESGREITYVERWQRIPNSSGPLLALSRPGGRIVRTGAVAQTIVDERALGGSFAAVAWRLDGANWLVDHCWPTGAQTPAPPVDIPTTETVVLSDGLSWAVEER